MKTLQILATSVLLLGLVQTANADYPMMHHEGPYTHSWQDADTNNDGVVTKEEFMAKHQERAEKMFSRLDANKDGKIDETERKTMRNRCDKQE